MILKSSGYDTLPVTSIHPVIKSILFQCLPTRQLFLLLQKMFIFCAFYINIQYIGAYICTTTEIQLFSKQENASQWLLPDFEIILQVGVLLLTFTYGWSHCLNSYFKWPQNNESLETAYIAVASVWNNSNISVLQKYCDAHIHKEIN